MSENQCDIRIHVATNYIDDQSEPDADRYVFAYTITICNNGAVPATLMSRHWIITDANGKVQEVSGDGVVGEQPYLQPGERSSALGKLPQEVTTEAARRDHNPDRPGDFLDPGSGDQIDLFEQPTLRSAGARAGDHAGSGFGRTIHRGWTMGARAVMAVNECPLSDGARSRSMTRPQREATCRE